MLPLEVIHTDKAPAAVGPYSQAIAANHMIYCSGQIALNPQTGEMVGTTVAEQTEQIMKNIGEVLVASGSGFEDVVRTTCYLTDMNEFANFNAVYGKYFLTTKPARSCVAVAALPKGALVEVEVTAIEKEQAFDL